MTLSNHQILLCFAADFIAVIGYFTAAYYIQFRRERRRVIQAESRERQAKLEAFWKEEQLRLNPRAVLIDRLPPVEKYSRHEWGWTEQHLVHAEQMATNRRIEEYSKKSMFASNRDEDISRQLEELKDFWK